MEGSVGVVPADEADQADQRLLGGIVGEHGVAGVDQAPAADVRPPGAGDGFQGRAISGGRGDELFAIGGSQHHERVCHAPSTGRVDPVFTNGSR
jgi:hypothetical protein